METKKLPISQIKLGDEVVYAIHGQSMKPCFGKVWAIYGHKISVKTPTGNYIDIPADQIQVRADHVVVNNEKKDLDPRLVAGLASMMKQYALDMYTKQFSNNGLFKPPSENWTLCLCTAFAEALLTEPAILRQQIEECLQRSGI